jgi:hypothetical protein
MQRGSLAIARSEDGMIMRHRIKSVAYKGKSSRGEPAEWVTIEPVARAIDVLERLSFRAASARGPHALARPCCKVRLQGPPLCRDCSSAQPLSRPSQ